MLIRFLGNVDAGYGPGLQSIKYLKYFIGLWHKPETKTKRFNKMQANRIF